MLAPTIALCLPPGDRSDRPTSNPPMMNGRPPAFTWATAFDGLGFNVESTTATLDVLVIEEVSPVNPLNPVNRLDTR
jgi:hypothetical protein